MKKLFGLFFFAGAVVLALNFSGHQSLNGVGSGVKDTTIFVAPDVGFYFVNGQLTLPVGSQVFASVSKNNISVYNGITGATGFQVRALALVTGDSINVRLRSSLAADQALNAVRGEVYYGNGL